MLFYIFTLGMMMRSTLPWLMFLLQRCHQRPMASQLDRCCWQTTAEASTGESVPLSPSKAMWARRRRGSVTVITAARSSVGARPRTVESPFQNIPKLPRGHSAFQILLLSHNALCFKSLPSAEVAWVTLHCS